MHGQWTDDPNNPLAICTATDVQKTVHIVADNSGGNFVFWIDNRNPVAGAAIYGQHIDADGNFLWSSNGKSILQTVGKSIIDFKMARWQNGIIITWLQSPGGYPDSMFCQYFNANGNALWPVPVNVSTASNGIISLSGGAAFNVFPNQFGATITYSYAYTGGSTFFCFNRVDFSGNLAFPINNFGITYGTYYDFRSCDDHLNGVYVLMKGNGLGSGMVIQRYDASGNAVFATPVDFTSGSAGFNGAISMNSDTNGALYVTWDSYGTLGILATKLTPSGNFAWSPSYRDVSDFESGQSNSYSILDEDKLFVAWNDNRPTANYAYIYIQKLDTSGIIEWTPGGVQASNLNSYIPNPKLIAAENGNVVATYEVNIQFYAQKFNSDSTIALQPNGDTISTNVSTPFYDDYELQYTSDGCTVAFWGSESGDIYGGRICDAQANVGVNEVLKEDIAAFVFPNPSESGIFEVTLSEPAFNIEVFDLAGRKIAGVEASNRSYIINISQFERGTYFVKASTKEGIVAKKLIIQ